MDGLLGWFVPAFVAAVVGLVTLWTAGAIHYDVCRGGRWGQFAAVAWVIGVAALFALWSPTWQPFLFLLAFETAFLVWWLRQTPRLDRDWEPGMAVLPRIVRDGDAVTVENVRDFEYHTPTDVVARYEDRTYRLANLCGVDLLLFVWTPLTGHPALVFDFGSDGRVCVSIEARLRKGQRYSLLRSLYRQHEIIFVVADERDVILRRTRHQPHHGAYLYRLVTTPGEVRTVFLDYVDAVNRLAEAPRWYHVLAANCTTSFYRLPNSRWRLDWRVLANGQLDRALYAAGRLDRSVSFAELRRHARLNEVANAAPRDGFGDHVRCAIEGCRHDR